MDILTLILARRQGGGGGSGSGLPAGGLQDQILVMGADNPYWEDPADMDDIAGLMAKYDVIPAFMDENGIILTDENFRILIR